MMNRRKQGGFNLVELMVGLVISLIVLGGAVYVFIGNSESNIFQMRSTRFTQQMRDVMDRMVADVRRAGYQGYKYYALATTVQIANPFDYDTALPPDPSLLTMTIKTSLDVGNRSGEAANSCVTYAYNLDDDYPTQVDVGTTTLPSAVFGSGDNELFGFQLRTSGGIGTVFMRTGGGGASFGCDSGDWVAVTDPDLVDITGLSFSLGNTECLNMTSSARDDCYGTATPSDATDDPQIGDLMVIVRELAIAMTGRSVSDTDLSFTLNQVVNLPNHRSIEVQ